MPVSKETLDEIALSQKEYQLIVKQLGREPNEVELGLFGSLWSEHCGYKHSKALLKKFPSTGKHVVVKPGVENAGVVDIGNGFVIALKMESHNHPSAIEPFQGAATGVGGIVRDIFTMGARPIALMNSLRFGPLSDPHNRYLLGGVVGGIQGATTGGDNTTANVRTGEMVLNADQQGELFDVAQGGGAGGDMVVNVNMDGKTIMSSTITNYNEAKKTGTLEVDFI